MQARIVSSRYIAIKRNMIFNVQPLHGRNNFKKKQKFVSFKSTSVVNYIFMYIFVKILLYIFISQTDREVTKK